MTSKEVKEIQKELKELLIERDTPKKIKIVATLYYPSPMCPNCKTELNEYYKNNYCKECGQRLDWSEW